MLLVATLIISVTDIEAICVCVQGFSILLKDTLVCSLEELGF